MSAILTANAAGFALNAGYEVIRLVYHVASDINTWVDNHIQQMKHSDNPTISRTGKVLEGAKLGFGLGYIAPVVVITLGQLLCGFTKAAIANATTAATLSNPIAMTCAALGAVYYGWNALSDQEKADTIERLREDLAVGEELVKSIANFVISETDKILSSENLKELKQFISETARTFGKTLSDVTHAIKDKVVDTYQKVKATSEELSGVVKERAIETYETIKTATEDASEAVEKTGADIADTTKTLVVESVERVKTVAQDIGKSAKEKLTKASNKEVE